MNDEHFGIPNPKNQVDIKYKHGRNSANQIIAERHQDLGESPDDGYKEKANDVEQQQNADMAIDDFDAAGVEGDKGHSKNGDNDDWNMQESYRDGDKDGGMG